MTVSLSYLLKKYRQEQKLSQAEVAALLKLSRVGYNALENSKAYPHPTTIKKISDLLEIDETILKNIIRKEQKENGK